MINIAICGILGKTGNTLFNLAKTDNDFNVVFGVDATDAIKNGTSVFNCFEKAEKSVEIRDSVIKKSSVTIDAIIDFSSPSALNGILNFAQKHSSAVVLATTGYTSEDVETINRFGEKIPVFYSQNLSLGIYAFISACKNICNSLFDFDIEIIEKHHKRKKDAPSGTALKIANEILPHINPKKMYAYDEKFDCLNEKINDIPVHSVRGGGIFGEHEVLFMTNDEIISIKHTALNRELFARSALDIAKFTVNMPCGVYGMNDYVKFSLKNR